MIFEEIANTEKQLLYLCTFGKVKTKTYTQLVNETTELYIKP